MISLRKYQKEAVDAVLKSYDNNIKKVGIVMAVGSGKTITFCSVIQEMIKRTGKQALILAHREELLQQAQDDLFLVNPNLSCSVEQGENYADKNSDVIIASVPTLGRSTSDRIKKFNPNDFCCVVTDEMHHFVNSTYTNVFNHFNVLKNINDNNKILLLGVTATGFRSDNQKLENIIDDIVYEYNIIQGIKQKYLTNLKAYTVRTKIDISKVKKHGGDFNIKDLGEKINKKSRNKIILDTYQNHCADQQTLIFCANVAHAVDVTKMFQDNGVKADYVVGTTGKEERKKIIDRFKKQKLNVLINVGVFTEGTNIPSIVNIIMARPTQSLGLYMQMIGRATRLYEGKDFAYIFDIVDNNEKQGVKSMASVLGIDGNLNFKGKDLIEIKDFVDQLKNLSPNIDWSRVNVNQPKKEIKRLDLLAGLCVPKEISDQTVFAWSKLSDGQYKIGLGQDQEKRFAYNIYLRENAIGKYEVYLNTFKKAERKHIWVKLKTGSNLSDAVNIADAKIANDFSDRYALIKRDAPWRLQETTQKQCEILTKFGVQKEMIQQMNKGQASFLLDKLFEQKPKKQLTPKQKAFLRWKGKF